MRVKLSRRKAKKGGKEYISYVIVLPKDIVEALSYSTLEDVEIEIKYLEGENVIVIKKPRYKGGD